MNKIFSCKPGVNIEDLQYMSPLILKMLFAYIEYCFTHALPCEITSLMEPAQGRITQTHSDGRAFDASVHGWNEFHIYRLIHKFNNEFKDIAAISKSDGIPRAVVYHKVDGGAYHFHFQTKRL